ncbi:hypothetical protein GCG54_00001053 [Colletotrichum gloeosporioides]|uniref:Uncharacterized protein n=1 Tax=Colletotrichum gloeosporioides TaxID=474922 RepID=A0A8H4C9R1_COLGL|nr:uncharacterized protein GCG54_00001053 [Colletotrichum gloeosporioides]KAF3799945.1 hypothetical protein GCG54_00001053 [Colletotrichum gloeosporioides]
MPVAEVSDNFEQPEAVETSDLALTTDLESPSTGLSKRAMNSKFKIHVVNTAARALGIIIIDCTINLLPGSHESTTANFDKLTNVRTNGPVVATHFEGGANPLAAAQNAVSNFATSMVSGVIDLSFNAAGVATGIASSTGIHLGSTVVAKSLHIFNENNAKISAINL